MCGTEGERRQHLSVSSCSARIHTGFQQIWVGRTICIVHIIVGDDVAPAGAAHHIDVIAGLHDVVIEKVISSMVHTGQIAAASRVES